MRLAYLFSRYPIVSQTFCDTEVLALERMGVEFEICSVYPPPTSFRHGHAAKMKAPIYYAPPPAILKAREAAAKRDGTWPERLVAEHTRKYGAAYKPELRARNALYIADLFQARGITHFHVHFANRAAHTALFVKAISGIPFSMSTHGQDYMVDLGNSELLCEICREAVFVANETTFSKKQVADLCPSSTAKMHRVFNGMDLANFPAPTSVTANPIPRIVSIGRLIEFKGFHHLIAACAKLRWRKLEFTCDIIGEGPWRTRLQEQIDQLELSAHVRLRGSLPQEEVFAELRACDIFALACTADEKGATDVFPTVILEAMASAKPVISTRLAGVPEQIVDGTNGLLVDPGDEGLLADALARVIESADLRRQYGQAGRRRLEEEFAVETTVQPLKKLFEEHVAPSTPPPAPALGLACLCFNWPPSDAIATELDAIEKMRAVPSAVYARDARELTKELSRWLSPYLRFLPDGMVLEGEWQQDRDVARRMETWRAALSQKLVSETFLQHARYALSLRRAIVEDGIRHLHATSAGELLTGWILRRLCGTTLTATLDENLSGLPASLVAEMAAECVAVRCPLKRVEVIERVEKLPAATRPRLTKYKPGRPPEESWLRELTQLSTLPPTFS